MSLRAWVRVDDDELRRWCSELLSARGHVVDDGVVPGGNVDVVVCDAGHVADVENGGARVVVVVDRADEDARRRLMAAGAAEVVERATVRPHVLVDVLERTPAHGTAALDDALAELRQSFARELPKRVGAIVVALDAVIAGADADADVEFARGAAVRAAHVLYGTAGSFGFPALSQACRHIELTLQAQIEKREPTTPEQARALKSTLASWA